MKKGIATLSLFAALTVFFAACNKSEHFEIKHPFEKGKHDQKAINFAAPNVFPEGVVYDASHDRFLVSSIAQGTIGAVTRKGIYTPFIQDAALVSTAGMEIDKGNKRLFVTNAKADGSLAQLAIYNLATKARLFLVDLAAIANDGAPHLVNDVALDQHGNAYVTDSYSGIIYKVDGNGKGSIFYQNAAFTPQPGGFGFNGIEYGNSKGGYLLVGHSANNQIVKIPIDNPAALSVVKLNPSIVSPDGLLLSKNGKELIVVNNTVQFPGSKVVSLETNDNWASASGSDAYETGIVYPTTITSDGKTEYVLYSYLHFLFGGQPKETFTIQPLPFKSNNPF